MNVSDFLRKKILQNIPLYLFNRFGDYDKMNSNQYLQLEVTFLMKKHFQK